MGEVAHTVSHTVAVINSGLEVVVLSSVSVADLRLKSTSTRFVASGNASVVISNAQPWQSMLLVDVTRAPTTIPILVGSLVMVVVQLGVVTVEAWTRARSGSAAPRRLMSCMIGDDMPVERMSCR